MRRTHGALVLLAGLACVPHAVGQSRAWDGGAGNQLWFQDLNWDPDGVPGIADSVSVETGGPVVCQSNTINVLSAVVRHGLVIDSGGLVLGADSQITGLTIQGCCTAVVDTSGALTIDGASAFLRGVRFQGSGETVINGTAFFDDDLFVEGGHFVTIAGEASTDDSIDPRNGSEVWVTGTLLMLPNAAFRGSSGGVSRNRGVVKSVAPGEVWVFGTLRTEGGTVLAEDGVFHLSGDNPVHNGTLEAREFAEIVVDSTAGPEIYFSSFTGEGQVTLRSGSALYTGRVESRMGGFTGHTEVRGLCRVDGLFVNYGALEFNGATLDSPAGTGQYEERGLAFVTAGSTAKLPLRVMDGGELALGAPVALQRDLTVEEGGEVSTQTPAGYLSGSPGRVSLAGTLRSAPPDGTTVTFAAPVDLQEGGRILAGSGRTQLRSDLVWSGGVAEARGLLTTLEVGEFGRRLSVVGDVELAGDNETISIGPSAHTLEIDGRLRVTSGASEYEQSVRISSRITGAGVLDISGSAWIWENASIQAAVANSGFLTLYGPLGLLATITNTGHVVQSGDLAYDQGAVVNSGEWRVAVSGGGSSRQQKVTAGLFTNTGLFDAVRQGSGEATHTVEVRFDNQGTVRAGGETMIVRFLDAAQVVGGVLTGGTWAAEFGGRIEFPGTAIVAIGSGSRVIGSTDSLPWMGGAPLIDGGVWEVRGDSALTLPLEVKGGAVDVETGVTDAPKIDVRDGGRLGVGDGARVRSEERIKIHSVIDDIDGVAQIGLLPEPGVIETPLVELGGRMRPGGPGRAGGFEIIGAVACAPGSRVVFDVGGAGDTDVVTATGSVSLTGATLEAALIDGFAPEGGESFTLIDAQGGVAGAFAALDLPALGPGLAWEVGYGETTVTLRVVGGGCRADWNGDGTVNTIDFIAYLGEWSAQRTQDCTGGGCSADLSGDGAVNTIDFIAFLGLWSAGC